MHAHTYIDNILLGQKSGDATSQNPQVLLLFLNPQPEFTFRESEATYDSYLPEPLSALEQAYCGLV